MRLSWNSTGNIINIEYTNGEVKECSGKLWCRVSDVIDSNIFNVINKYWSTRTPEVRGEWENLYRTIFSILDQYHNAHVASELLKPHIERMFQLMEWEQFKTWCKLHGNIVLANGIKETLDDKDKAGLTYYTRDYEELMIFSVMLKPMIPIWGAFHNDFTDAIGKHFVHMSAIKLMMTPSTINIPPLQKLENYIEHFIGNNIKNIGYSLLNDIGTEEIPFFLVSLAIIKKIIIFNTEDPVASIVKNVYHLLIERCTEISNSKPTNKKKTDNEGEDITIGDRYKIIQRIPPGISAVMDYYAEDFTRIARDIDKTIPNEILMKYKTIDLTLWNIKEYHLPLLGIICRKVISARTLELISFSSLLNYVRAASAIIEHWGYSEISDLLILSPAKRDMYCMTSSVVGNRTYTLLTPDLENRLNLLYKYQSNQKNPGINLINDIIIKESMKYDWENTSPNFINIRNSVAQLLIRQLGGE
jgi:hypothetical protein